MPLRVLAALVALLLIPATASASYDGSTGKVAYVDSENGLYIDDPFDDQPAQGPLATVASEDVQTKAMAYAQPARLVARRHAAGLQRAGRRQLRDEAQRRSS